MLDLRRGARGRLLTPFGQRVVEFVLWMIVLNALAFVAFNH